jgi:CRISPR-associated protein Cmr3
MTSFYFVEPVDSLFVRGNLAFGDSGEHGAGVIPPSPSLFAGAFRSAILGADPDALVRFVRRGATGDAKLDAVLGTLTRETGSITQPGAFRLTWSSLAGRKSGKVPMAVEPVFALPADLVRLEKGFAQLTPHTPSALVVDGRDRDLPDVAILRTGKQTKPLGGSYLRAAGWRTHLSGETPDSDADAVKAVAMHGRDPRLGIGLNAGSRTVESGLIYTTEGHAFSPPAALDLPGLFDSTGFLVGLDGVEGILPETGFLRLGGDGRGAHCQRVDYQPPAAPLDTIARAGRFRLILTTPGLFADGWLPPCVSRETGSYRLQIAGCTARLVCAAVPRREIVSGWDLLAWKPKDAQRAAPAGSVYWFENLHGPPEKLAAWLAGGLWGDNIDHQRRAEGYNLATLAAWT